MCRSEDSHGFTALLCPIITLMKESTGRESQLLFFVADNPHESTHSYLSEFRLKLININYDL